MNTRIAEILREYREVCFKVRDNKPSIDGLVEGNSQAEQALLVYFDEVIGGDLGGKFYTTRKLKEIDGLTAVNNFKSELRQKLGIK